MNRVIKEKDAGNHVCPLTLGGGYSRQYCKGEKCMMWQWANKKNPDWVGPTFSNTISTTPCPHPDDEEPVHIPDTKKGYCGLKNS